MEYFWDIVRIVFADIILSGDNALVIGMAAAGLSPELRKKAIFWGMAMAAGLRIFFAVIASYLISIPGILFIGGLLLSWVCWRFFLEIREQQHEDDEAAEGLEEDDNAAGKTLWSALRSEKDSLGRSGKPFRHSGALRGCFAHLWRDVLILNLPQP